MRVPAVLIRRAWRRLTGRARGTRSGAPGPRADAAAWLVQLRWAAVVGQLVTVAVVRWVLRVEVPHGPLLWVVAVTAGTNALLAWWLSSRFDHGPPGEPDPRLVPALGAAMLLDLALLTALLYFTGGPNNPFYGFYFVNLALAAALLPTRWAWACDAAAVAGYGLLVLAHRPLPELGGEEPPLLGPDGAPLSLLAIGRLVAFLTCSGVVVYFATLLRDRVRQRDRQVRRVEGELARSQKLEALGTLAAGAAHELSTPLGTIAVVTKEVSRRIERAAAEDLPASLTLREKTLRDVRLIRSEVDSCRSILDRMSADAGEAVGEVPAAVSPQELIEEVLSGVRDRAKVRVEAGPGTGAAVLHVPRVRLAQALRGLVQNAVTACRGRVVVRVVVGGFPADRPAPDPGRVNAAPGVRVDVSDDGAGMTPAVLARVGEPFFTTKEPGRGTGLGVFLARAVIERLGGRLTFESTPGEGTTARVRLPVRVPEFPPPI